MPAADPSAITPPGAIRTLDARRASGGRRAAAWIGRQLLGTLVVLWGAVTVTFLALSFVKGDTLNAIVGPAQVSDEVKAQIIADYHLDDSPIQQYVSHLARLVQGDLGESYALRKPVASAIGEQIVPTFQLLGAAIVLSLVASLAIALLTANRPRWIRGASSGVEVSIVAIPTFWFGILLLSIFSFGLGWLPAVGSGSPAALTLPAVSLAAVPTAMLVQVLRQGLERVSTEPFVVTARTRGLSEGAVLVRHVLRHAVMPVVTLSGYLAGALISGAVVIEQVFARPGLGRLLVAAVGSKDFPLIIGVVLVAALFYAVVNVVIDAAYTWLDPRLRKDAA